MQDEAMIEEGLAILDTGIENYPEFVLFSKLLTYADEDVNSPEFQNAFEAVRDKPPPVAAKRLAATMRSLLNQTLRTQPAQITFERRIMSRVQQSS